ncbi:AbrB family transcriptional regulator [Synechococcales cyanobacterium C]|uniref:AbrB family transcriptional regulator n=1 Tax=Petrachloros mirabilis ULC683 TaxID=2781853 RepID=A0A8K2A6I5_9CYAN|nr:AbrB family transcriptional regulator [Petrachloros mirabilis]NCJ05275.1 AbrB family transcriptional regulator [Petrachloros mirabilis ULC683]
MAKRKKTQIKPLTGEALIQKVKTLNHLSRELKAKECGYYTVTEKGDLRVNMVQFMNALIEAEGISLDAQRPDKPGRGGRKASYRVSVQANGNLLIGSAYTEKMSLKPGDTFQVFLKRRHIHLQLVSASDSEASGDS